MKLKMKIINGFSLMKYAERFGYVLPAFNTTNLEMTYAIARGLNATHLPGYIQISSNNLRLSDPQIISDITREALKNVDTPIALHLDHGQSFEDVKACIEAGFTSIMIDASKLPYEDNIREVRRTAEYCHLYGIPVEAELGMIGGKEDTAVNEADAKTDPDMVEEFVEKTQCDLLAVSVGNVHGLNAEPNIDLPLLKRISEVSKVPLVLHGGSGIPFDVIRAARAYNLIKINFGSDLRKAFIQTFGEAFIADHNSHDVISLSLKSVENVSKEVQELVKAINE